jgi:hypothetical protein
MHTLHGYAVDDVRLKFLYPPHKPEWMTQDPVKRQNLQSNLIFELRRGLRSYGSTTFDNYDFQSAIVASDSTIASYK